MRNVEIDEDIYEHLVSEQTDFGQSISEVLRRLLDLAPAEVGEASEEHDEIVPVEVRDFIAANLRHGNATSKYLKTLAFLYSRHPGEFDRLLSIKGRNRVYFSQSKEEIEESGTHTRPVQIPESNYFVVTNSPTRRKRIILREAMQALGYDEASIRAVLAAIR